MRTDARKYSVAGQKPKVCFASPRTSSVRSSRQAARRVANAASSGARSPQGDPTFELMAAEKRWEDSVGTLYALSARVCRACTRFDQGLSGADACHADQHLLCRSVKVG